ncbi:TlpA disulfide reductase family protein [Porticoccaceae bacterium LTM1]|nr:TlpA disulfide reductase family protein [Porticoccaceae bacterium LTM1]
MRKIVLALLSFVFSSVASASVDFSGYAKISGDISVGANKNIVSLLKTTNGKLKEVATSTVDDKGRFSFMVPVDESGFYRIDYAGTRQNQIVRLYLEKGLSISLDISSDSYELEGSDTYLNEVVQDWGRIYNQFIPYTRPGGALTYKDYFPFLVEEAVPALMNFKKSLSTGDEQFNRLMKLSAESDLEWASYQFLRMPRMFHPKPEHYPKIYADWVDRNKFQSADYLKIDNAVSLIDNYFFREALRSGSPKVGEILSGPLQSIGPDDLKEAYLQERLKPFLERRPSDEMYFQMVDPVRKYMSSNESQELLFALDKYYLTKVGSPGFDFNFENSDGDYVSLSSLKGKVVYIDLWATWCGPCKAQIPYIQELEKDFHDQDIVFVSISSDDDQDTWREFVDEEDLSGIQLIADSESWRTMVKLYDIAGIPRFIILDKNGNIVDLNAPRPSDTELKVKLEGLLSQ